MTNSIPEHQRLDPIDLQHLQRQKLEALLGTVLAASAFYRDKFGAVRFNALTDPLDGLPLTTRQEIEADQVAHPPYGRLLTAPLSTYRRLHHTSGSTGHALAWLDTAESWEWFKRCWDVIYSAAGLSEQDRLMFPFSFGPFIGFWAAFERAAHLGFFVLPAGGMSTVARLRWAIKYGITVMCCTPTYALRMAEVAEEEGIDLGAAPVKALIVAGEPGGNIPATRARLEALWHARVFDHAGMTEMGPWGFECLQAPGGMHIMEDDFIAEVVDPRTGEVLPEGQPGELVLTNLGRSAMPLIRYRTGDQVTLQRGACPCGRSFARVEGGIVGRVDDMLIVRGNNVFPATIENVLRTIPEVAEFRIAVQQPGALAELRLDVEPVPGAATDDLEERIRSTFVDQLYFKPVVQLLPQGALPRFELKARRFVREDPAQSG